MGIQASFTEPSSFNSKSVVRWKSSNSLVTYFFVLR